MSVTGLVLTIGESTTQRAISALESQTCPPDDIVVVQNVLPFHRAMNEGISRIKTEHFLQCDADMVPDPDCIEIMSMYTTLETGVVIAHLEDELMGKIQAIKFFRTDFAQEYRFTDHVSPDTNYILRLADMGIKYVFAMRRKPMYGHDIDILPAEDLIELLPAASVRGRPHAADCGFLSPVP